MLYICQLFQTEVYLTLDRLMSLLLALHMLLMTSSCFMGSDALLACASCNEPHGPLVGS